MSALRIGSHVVNDDSPMFVIAEVGHNHQGKLETAKKLFHAAKKAGAQAVKLQKRDNRVLYTREMYDEPYVSPNAYAPTYGQHRDYLEFGASEWDELTALAKELDILFFATPFDLPSVDFLARYDPPAYKTASGDLTNIPLLKYVASMGKPMLVSTGGAGLEDVRRAHDAIMPINAQLCLLQCTAEYPAKTTDLNIRVIQTYQREFPNVVAGWSSHDDGTMLAVAAYSVGARVLEKHFTLDRTMKGTDHKFSLEPGHMAEMVSALSQAREALGNGVKQRLPEEHEAVRKMGKSLYAQRDLPVGHVLTADDIMWKSPGGKLAPYNLERIIGLRLNRGVDCETAFTMEMLEAAPEAQQVR